MQEHSLIISSCPSFSKLTATTVPKKLNLYLKPMISVLEETVSKCYRGLLLFYKSFPLWRLSFLLCLWYLLSVQLHLDNFHSKNAVRCLQGLLRSKRNLYWPLSKPWEGWHWCVVMELMMLELWNRYTIFLRFFNYFLSLPNFRDTHWERTRGRQGEII